MSGLLAFDVYPGTSALERLLSVVRRRGFHVDALQAVRKSGDNHRLEVELTVSGERDVDVLSRHLANLGDCRLLSVRQQPAARAAGGDAS
ncbi:MAG: ACT domain-containing protein [Acidobacteriota bacterium]